MNRTRIDRRESMVLIAILTALATVLAVSFRPHFHPRHHNASRAFRDYIADRHNRMVVYSPDLDAGIDDEAIIRKQLSFLRLKFDGIVLYECSGESDLILRTAESLGFRAALLTIWSPRSEDEVQRAAQLVRDHRSRMALAVSIGSEGIMERRYTLHDVELAQDDLFRFSATDAEVETTTTEPWWVYASSTPDAVKLSQFGDFICVNIHVIWDTDLTAPATAAAWTADRARDLGRTTGRPVLIREAGYPGGGYSPRPNSSFQFSRNLQLAFWQTWNTRFGASAPPIVAFEGIDNPAKRWKSFESTWGLLTPDLQPHPAWEAFPTLAPQHSELR